MQAFLVFRGEKRHGVGSRAHGRLRAVGALHPEGGASEAHGPPGAGREPALDRNRGRGRGRARGRDVEAGGEAGDAPRRPAHPVGNDQGAGPWLASSKRASASATRSSRRCCQESIPWFCWPRCGTPTACGRRRRCFWPNSERRGQVGCDRGGLAEHGTTALRGWPCAVMRSRGGTREWPRRLRPYGGPAYAHLRRLSDHRWLSNADMRSSSNLDGCMISVPAESFGLVPLSVIAPLRSRRPRCDSRSDRPGTV